MAAGEPIPIGLVTFPFPTGPSTPSYVDGYPKLLIFGLTSVAALEANVIMSEMEDPPLWACKHKHTISWLLLTYFPRAHDTKVSDIIATFLQSSES